MTTSLTPSTPRPAFVDPNLVIVERHPDPRPEPKGCEATANGEHPDKPGKHRTFDCALEHGHDGPHFDSIDDLTWTLTGAVAQRDRLPLTVESLAAAFRKSGMSVAFDSDAIEGVAEAIIEALEPPAQRDRLRDAPLIDPESDEWRAGARLAEWVGSGLHAALHPRHSWSGCSDPDAVYHWVEAVQDSLRKAVAANRGAALTDPDPRSPATRHTRGGHPKGGRRQEVNDGK